MVERKLDRHGMRWRSGWKFMVKESFVWGQNHNQQDENNRSHENQSREKSFPVFVLNQYYCDAGGEEQKPVDGAGVGREIRIRKQGGQKGYADDGEECD